MKAIGLFLLSTFILTLSIWATGSENKDYDTNMKKHKKNLSISKRNIYEYNKNLSLYLKDTSFILGKFKRSNWPHEKSLPAKSMSSSSEEAPGYSFQPVFGIKKAEDLPLMNSIPLAFYKQAEKTIKDANPERLNESQTTPKWDSANKLILRPIEAFSNIIITKSYMFN